VRCKLSVTYISIKARLLKDAALIIHTNTYDAVYTPYESQNTDPFTLLFLRLNTIFLSRIKIISN
jgi:hypothetical protein